MRITNRYMSNQMLNSIQSNLSKLARSQEQMATSRSLLRLSDNPNVLGQYMAIKSVLSYNEQYDKNLSDGVSYLEMADTSMGTLGSLLQQTIEYTVQAANGTYNEEDRAAVAAQVDKLIDQVVDLGNSTVGAKYIYAGTQNDDPPFTRTADGKIIYSGNTQGVYREVVAGSTYRIDTLGVTTGFQIKFNNPEAKTSNDEPKIISRQTDRQIYGELMIKVSKAPSNQVEIDASNLVDADGNNLGLGTATVAFTGTEDIELGGSVFGGKLDGLKIDFEGSNNGAEYTFRIDDSAGLYGTARWDDDNDQYVVYDPNNPPAADERGIFDVLFELKERLSDPTKTDLLQDSIEQLNAQHDHTLQMRVAAGARYRHFKSLQDQILDQKVILTGNLKDVEGADMAELSIEYSQQILTYNASLAVGSNIMQTSLLNFLK